jgi:anaerobic selenocysteine-containing dehydrogenase
MLTGGSHRFPAISTALDSSTAGAERTVAGACSLDCPDTCSWHVHVKDGRVLRVTGDRAHPFTRGALCGKVSRYAETLYSPERVLHPLRRVGAKGEGRFERIGWDEAIETIASRLSAAIAEHGAQSVLPYYSGGTLGKLQCWLMAERLFGFLGASYPVDTICSAATQAGFNATLGGSVGFDPEDLVQAKLVLIWGTNTLSSNVHQWKFVAEARERGAHVVTIDPLRTDTARRSDEHIALFPGSDAALALGLMRVVVDLGAHDEDWLERHTVGWPGLRARLEEWPVERAASVCRLDPGTIRALGERLAESRPTAIRTLLGMQRHGGAAAAVRAVCAIPAVTGDWRYPGGGVLAMTWGHSPVGAPYPSDLPRPATRDVNMSRLAEALGDTMDPPVKAFVVMNANPAAATPAQLRVRDGLMREDLFTVVLEHWMTDTVDYADIVLPATMQPEHVDVMTGYGHHYVAWNEPAVDPPGECLPNTEIFRRLAAAMGADHPRLRDSDVQLAAQVLAPAGLSVDELRERHWARAANFARGEAPFADGGFPTPSGRVELRSETFAADGHDAIVDYVPPHEAGDLELERRFPLVLMATAARYFTNSQFATSDWHVGRMGPPRVHIHPSDAAARGLATADAIRIFNDRGEFFAEAVVDDAARPGVAFTYKHYWPKRSRAGTTVNATTPERDTDSGGGPTFHDNRVEVEPAGMMEPAR